jgi:3-oxoadipate enol-lactonase / 4-carboxymuconolactone decarboxylase
VTLDLAITDFGGTGDLLVVGPSLGTTARNLWGEVAARLTDRFRVLAWDLPGHGDSPAAAAFTVGDLATAVLAAAPARFRCTGVSLGGAVGLQLLLDAPERVTSAVLLSTGARIGTADMWRERAARVRRDGVRAVLAETPARWFAGARRDSAPAKALLDDLAATDATSYAAACDALALFDVRARLSEIAAPVLAVAGAEDPVSPPAALRHVAEGVQHGRLVVLPSVAHQIPVEAPEVVAELIGGVTDAAPRSMAELRADGMRIRREVLGDAHVDRASASADDLTREFQEFITTYAWGAIWTRPGLDRRSRSLITLTALVARGHDAELAMHLRAARRNGLTRDEIKEALFQAAIYCGVPDANTAFRIAQDVFREDDA